MGEKTLSAGFDVVARELGRAWGLPKLAKRVDVRFSRRLTRSIGRAEPATGRVRLSEQLKGHDELLREALCHELAHVAVYLRHGRHARPHGPEWRQLMIEAGYEPRTRLAASLVPTAPNGRRSYRHLCPVCHESRIAYQRMRRWRCARCLDNGLDGELVIEAERS